MATLIFSDGTKKVVPYNVAAKIYQILIGSGEPENVKQRDYVSRVKEVQFDGQQKPIQRPASTPVHGK